ncbi:TetR/AcrR family transcriptional regulator C-terminal domain-containing protein [Catellatospora vulcania]|uniref:TetR/AcrR family transcriptional regulator C-terminal domain-containing protein n=1 Tax=Catellatospora vulcania TaxID=1460450 RepID=UPI0012D3DB2D|nr:TetR/AcrR family transcriptional regulator C-terminal domain-containing protein [Catellatospora vulcania]
MPRDTLTRAQIVQTAIALLDEQGLDGLNMRSLGKRLNAAATAVYWHVKNKDELVVAAGDHVWQEIDLPDPAPEDWQQAATSLATGLHDTFARHPWLVPAFGSHLFHGPGKARFDDRCLAVYEAAGFTGARADQAAGAVFTFVLGSVLGTSAATALSLRRARDGADARAQLDQTTAKAREIAMRYPRLRARLDDSSTAGYAAAPEQTFDVGLRALLHGLAAQLTDSPSGNHRAGR